VADVYNVDAADASAADEWGRRPGGLDEETGSGVLRGNGNAVAESAPPLPAKDGDTASVSAT
jgi:hypothetical protein